MDKMNPKILIGVIVLGFASAMNLMYERSQPDPGLGLIAGLLLALITPFLGSVIALKFRSRRGQDNWT